MPTNQYLIRKQQLASVFEDTMAQIKQSEEWMSAIDYSIHNQQFIPESAIISISDVPKPANIIVSQLRSFEAAAQYIGKRTAVLNFASATNPGGGVDSPSGGEFSQGNVHPVLEFWKVFYFLIFFCLFIQIFGCAGSSLGHTGSSVSACGI